jgi:hypothetical protein
MHDYMHLEDRVCIFFPIPHKIQYLTIHSTNLKLVGTLIEQNTRILG